MLKPCVWNRMLHDGQGSYMGTTEPATKPCVILRSTNSCVHSSEQGHGPSKVILLLQSIIIWRESSPKSCGKVEIAINKHRA